MNLSDGKRIPYGEYDHYIPLSPERCDEIGNESGDNSKVCAEYKDISSVVHQPLAERNNNFFNANEFGKRLAEDKLMMLLSEKNGNIEDIMHESGRDLWHVLKRRQELAAIALSQCAECPFSENRSLDCPGKDELEAEAYIESGYEKSLWSLQKDIAARITESIPGSVVTGGIAMKLLGIDRYTDDIDIDVPPSSGSTSSVLDYSWITKVKNSIGETLKANTELAMSKGKVISDDVTTEKKNTIKTYRLNIPLQPQTNFLSKEESHVENIEAEKISESNTSDGVHGPKGKEKMVVYGKTLKVEFKRNDKLLPGTDDHKETDETMVINGVRIYTPQSMLARKMITFIERTKVRDPYDIAFLLYKYPETITNKEKVSIEILEGVLNKLHSALDDEPIRANTSPLEKLGNINDIATLPAPLQSSKAAHIMLEELNRKITEEINRRSEEVVR